MTGPLLEPITNRVSGAQYSASDLNRVGTAIAYISNRLAVCGYAVNTLPKVDWATTDIQRVSQMTRYLGDVQRIKAAFYGSRELPDSMSKLTYQDANNIEKALLEVDELLSKMIAALCFVDDCYSGEGYA